MSQISWPRQFLFTDKKIVIDYKIHQVVSNTMKLDRVRKTPIVSALYSELQTYPTPTR